MATKKTRRKPRPVLKTYGELAAELVHLGFQAAVHDETLWVGIDIGVGGGIGFLWRDRAVAFDMPTVTVRKYKTVRGRSKKGDVTEYDYAGIVRLFDVAMTDLSNVGLFVSVETPQVMGYGASRGRQFRGKANPGRDGARDTPLTAARMYWGGGIWPLFLTDRGIKFKYAPPSVWKKAMGLGGKGKEASRRLAVRLFPTAELTRVKDHNRAEALLLAEFARRQASGGTDGKIRVRRRRA